MRRTRRSKYTIAADIIKAISKPSHLTDIVYTTRLNFTIARKYIDHLIENRLISFDDKTQTYEVVTKGKKYLDTFRQVQKMYGE